VSAPPPPRPGTQVERTQFSWARTALAALALAALALKAGLRRDDAVAVITGATATLAAAVIYACGRARARPGTDRPGGVSPAAVGAVAGLSVIAGLATIITVLAG
jgi:hypothetical protein